MAMNIVRLMYLVLYTLWREFLVALDGSIGRFILCSGVLLISYCEYLCPFARLLLTFSQYSSHNTILLRVPQCCRTGVPVLSRRISQDNHGVLLDLRHLHFYGTSVPKLWLNFKTNLATDWLFPRFRHQDLHWRELVSPQPYHPDCCLD